MFDFRLKENLKKSDPERAEEIKQPLTDFVKGTLLPNFNKIRAFYAGITYSLSRTFYQCFIHPKYDFESVTD